MQPSSCISQLTKQYTFNSSPSAASTDSQREAISENALALFKLFTCEPDNHLVEVTSALESTDNASRQEKCTKTDKKLQMIPRVFLTKIDMPPQVINKANKTNWSEKKKPQRKDIVKIVKRKYSLINTKTKQKLFLSRLGLKPRHPTHKHLQPVHGLNPIITNLIAQQHQHNIRQLRKKTNRKSVSRKKPVQEVSHKVTSPHPNKPIPPSDATKTPAKSSAKVTSPQPNKQIPTSEAAETPSRQSQKNQDIPHSTAVTPQSAPPRRRKDTVLQKTPSRFHRGNPKKRNAAVTPQSSQTKRLKTTQSQSSPERPNSASPKKRKAAISTQSPAPKRIKTKEKLPTELKSNKRPVLKVVNAVPMETVKVYNSVNHNPKVYAPLVINTTVHTKSGKRITLSPCPICQKGINKHKLCEHVESVHNKFLCLTCRSIFTTAKYYKDHIKKHTEDSFKCDTCGKTFGYESDLFHHAITHSEEKTIPCEKCDKLFKRQSDLNYHVREKHPVKPRRRPKHECKSCHKTYATKKSLNQHLKSHKSKRYVCSQCNKKFTWAMQLYRHNKDEH